MVSLVLVTWLALSPLTGAIDDILVQAMGVMSWGAGTAVVIWAGAEGIRSARVAYRRWPGHRNGLAALGVVFVGVLGLFLGPSQGAATIFGPLTVPAAVLLALAVTIWIALPVVTGLAWLLAGPRLSLPVERYGSAETDSLDPSGA